MSADALRLDGLDPASATARVLLFVDRWRYALFVGVAVLHVSAFTGRWRPGGDSAAFLVLGRRLQEHGDLTTVTGYGHGVMPGYPWLLAQLMRFSDDPTSAALVLNLAAVTAWLAFVFLAVRIVIDRPTAVLTTLLCGVSARSMEAGADVLPGMLFAALLAGGLWAQAWRNTSPRIIGLAVLIPAMVTLRSVGVLFALAWVLTVCWGWVRRSPDRSHEANGHSFLWARLLAVVFLTGVTVAAVALIPGVSRDARLLLGGLRDDGWARVFLAVRETVVWSAPEAVLGLDPSVYVGPVLGVVILLAGVALVRVRVFWGWLVLLFVLPWLLFVSTPRYVVPVLPLLVLGLWCGVVRVEKRWPAAWSGWAVFVGLALLVTANTVGVGKLVLEQRREPFLTRYRQGKYVVAHELSGWLRDQTPAGARVLCTLDERAAVTWWSGRDALSVISTPAMNAGVLYAVVPLDDATEQAMQELGWTLGPALTSASRPYDKRAWMLHQVQRPDVVAAEQDAD